MDYKRNQHYVNKHGQQLKDFMILKFGKRYYYIWCLLNAFKYQARAGKKEGNSYTKDIVKRDDYLKELNNSEWEHKQTLSAIVNNAKEFEEWEGK